jgi:hypothetical protein
MHQRYYSLHLGRFLSVDPVSGNPPVPQGWNRYSYVLGNPLKYVDPYGLQPGCRDGFCTDPIPRGFFDFLNFGSFLRNLSFFGSGFGARSPTAPRQPGLGPSNDPCEDSSNVVLDTLEGVIEDIGPITLTGSVPLYPLPGLAGLGGSASFTARPDGSSDLYVGIGGVIGSSARASSLGASFLKASSGGRPGGFTLRGAAAAGLLNLVGIPLGVRGSGMITQQGDNASVGLGVVGGASGSVTGGYTFHVTDPYRGGNCR